MSLDLSLLRGLRRELSAWLSQAQVTGEASDAIILATHEAAANAIEHARLGTEVTIRGVRDADEVFMVIVNRGAWKKERSVDEKRGRGLILMKQLMSDLDIQVKSRRTVVRMRKHLSPSAQLT